MNLSKNQLERMARLGIRREDLEESACRSAGPGGQNVNKVSTAVRLVHRPSGVSVRVQESRSQSMNRETAIDRLLDVIEQRGRARRQAVVQHREKERRRNRKRPRGLKERILESKKRRSVVKFQRRGRVDE